MRDEEARVSRAAQEAAELRRQAARLGLPVDAEALDLTPTGVLALLGGLQRAHDAQLSAVQQEAQRLALEVHAAETQALQSSNKQQSAAEQARVHAAAQATELVELQSRHAELQHAAEQRLAAMQQRVASLQAENERLLALLQQHMQRSHAEADKQRIFAQARAYARHARTVALH